MLDHCRKQIGEGFNWGRAGHRFLWPASAQQTQTTKGDRLRHRSVLAILLDRDLHRICRNTGSSQLDVHIALASQRRR
jgi:hypothetical protein